MQLWERAVVNVESEYNVIQTRYVY